MFNDKHSMINVQVLAFQIAVLLEISPLRQERIFAKQTTP